MNMPSCTSRILPLGSCDRSAAFEIALMIINDMNSEMPTKAANPPKRARNDVSDIACAF
jgi:hypothetical protein